MITPKTDATDQPSTLYPLSDQIPEIVNRLQEAVKNQLKLASHIQNLQKKIKRNNENGSPFKRKYMELKKASDQSSLKTKELANTAEILSTLITHLSSQFTPMWEITLKLSKVSHLITPNLDHPVARTDNVR